MSDVCQPSRKEVTKRSIILYVMDKYRYQYEYRTGVPSYVFLQVPVKDEPDVLSLCSAYPTYLHKMQSQFCEWREPLKVAKRGYHIQPMIILLCC